MMQIVVRAGCSSGRLMEVMRDGRADRQAAEK